jgi:hypothetical protein
VNMTSAMQKSTNDKAPSGPTRSANANMARTGGDADIDKVE